MVNTDHTARLADDPNASSYARAGFAWATQGHRDLMRKQLANLSPAHLDEATLAACIYIAAASEIAEELTAVALLTPDSLALPQRLATECAWCGELDCTDRWAHDRLDAGSETTWRRRAR